MAAFELRERGRGVPIGNIALDVLAYLISHRDRTISREELLQDVWGAPARSPSTVPTTIAEIRKALGDDADHSKFVRTVRGRGYQFIGNCDPSTSHCDSAKPALALVGRRNELGAIIDALHATGSGDSAILLFEGKSGLGKTRLLETVSTFAKQRALIPLLGRCRETHGAPPFWPWIQIFRSLLRNPTISSTIPREVTELITGGLGADPLWQAETLEASKARFALFDRLSIFLRNLTVDTPIVLLFDDLHTSDIPSLLLLEFVVSDPSPRNPTIVGAWNDSASCRKDRGSLIARLSARPNARLLRIDPLTRDNVEELLQDEGRRVRGQAALLHDLSGGNPLFLHHLVQATRKRPDDHTGDIVGTGIRHAILEQIHQLPESTQEALRAAAAVGRSFPLGPIADSLGRRYDALLTDLEPAIRSSIISIVVGTTGAYRFSHPIVRDVLYSLVPVPQRPNLHLRIARSFQAYYRADVTSHAAELAFHFTEAIPVGGAHCAFTHSRTAAENAGARLAFEESIGHYENALAILTQSEFNSELARCRILLPLGAAQLRASRRQAGRRTLVQAASIARSLHNPELLARAALGLAPGPLAWEVGVFDPLLVKTLEDAVVATKDREPRLHAQLLARLAIALAWTNSEIQRRTAAENAVSIARTSRDPETLRLALIAHHSVLGGPAGLGTRMRIADEIGELAQQLAGSSLDLMHHILRITGLIELGNVRALDSEIEVFSQRAALGRMPQLIWYSHLFRAMRTLATGQFSEAARRASRFLDLGHRANDKNADHSFGAHEAIRLWELGQPLEAANLAEFLSTRFPLVDGWRAARAFFLLDAGRRDVAARLFDEIGTEDLSHLPRNEVWTTTIAVLSQVCSDLQRRTSASMLYDLLADGEGQCVALGFAVTSLGSIDRYLGRLAATLGRWDQSVRHLKNAIKIDRRTGSVPWRLRAQCDLASVLLQRGRRSERPRARDILAEVVHVTTSLGMKTLARKATLLAGSAHAG